MDSLGPGLRFRATDAPRDPRAPPRPPQVVFRTCEICNYFVRLLLCFLGRAWTWELHQHVGLQNLVPESTHDGMLTRLPRDAMERNVKNVAESHPKNLRVRLWYQISSCPHICIYTYESRNLFGNKLAPLGFLGGSRQHFFTFRSIASRGSQVNIPPWVLSGTNFLSPTCW